MLFYSRFSALAGKKGTEPHVCPLLPLLCCQRGRGCVERRRRFLFSGKGAPQPVHARQTAAERGIEHELLHAHPRVGQPQMHHALPGAERDRVRKAQLVKAAYIGPAEQLALRQLVHRAVLPEPHRRAAQHHACSHARQAVALPLGRVAGIEDAERRFAALPQADTAPRDPDGRLFRVFPAVFTRSVPFLCQCIRNRFLRLSWFAAGGSPSPRMPIVSRLHREPCRRRQRGNTSL